MRLRQICLVAEDLQTSLKTLAELLGSPVTYRDPEVAQFGLENGLIMTGGDFVEVVSPLADSRDTAAKRHLARCGDSFYMAIFQCANATPLITHIKDNGGRGVFEIDAGGVRATHFHPKDFGGAIVSVDSMGRDDWQSPQAYWQWAHWPPENSAAPDTDTSVGALAGLRVSAGAPAYFLGGPLERNSAASCSVECEVSTSFVRVTALSWPHPGLHVPRSRQPSRVGSPTCPPRTGRQLAGDICTNTINR